MSETISKVREKPGESNAGKYTHVSPENFAGPDETFPINTIERARNALARAHYAKNPEVIKKKVYEKWPSLKPKKENDESLSNSHKFKKVMKEFANGTLKSSSGETVTSQEQALAIAYSEAKESKTDSIMRFDNGEIQSTAGITEEGFLSCNAIVTRTGVFVYQNADGTTRRELRHPEDILLDDSLESMKMIPVTNDHPEERLVTPENSKKLSVGFTGEKVRKEGKFIYTNFLVTDEETINQILNEGKRELSLGYTVDLIEEPGFYEGEPYDYRQINVNYNHLSIVRLARAGREACIALDSQDAIEISQTEGKEMAKRKIKIDEEEFLMEPEAAESVERLLADMKNLEDEKMRVEEELGMIKDKLEKALGERDAAKEEAERLLKETDQMKGENEKEEVEKEKMDAINKRVAERIDLLKKAEKVLDSEKLEKIDSLTDLEIKKMIIIEKSPKANLDDKTEVYINARYDAIVEELPKHSMIVKNVKGVKTDQKTVSANDSRNKMIEDMKNNYKRGG